MGETELTRSFSQSDQLQAHRQDLHAFSRKLFFGWPMAVTIEAIKFDHDRTLARTDALTIRRNADEEITPPEWKRRETGGPLISPVAYARSQGNRLTIAVQLRRTSISSDGSVRVSAQGGGILGTVGEDTIDFPSQRLVSDFKVFNLVGATIAQTGVGTHDITWNWSLRPNGGVTTPKQTTHQIYTLLDLPKAPWGQPGSTFPGFQVPWADALFWACKWASGATTPDQAADKITREIHRLGQTKVQFDNINLASSHFTIPGYRTFRCPKFLRLLSRATPTRALVNCTDCAVFVSSFMNILGGDLNQSRMGSDFNTNLIVEIGLIPDHRTTYTYHEVAWKSPCNASAPLFDSSLQVDAVRPTDDDFESPILGIAIPLGTAGTNYHLHLVAPSSANRCRPLGGTCIRRKIEGTTVRKRQVVPEVERLLKEKYDFPSWNQTQTSDEHIFLWHFSQNHNGFSPSDWTSQSSENFEGRSGAPDVTDSIWTTDKGDAVLRELTYECDSRAEAHSMLLGLLDEFQRPGITRRSNFNIGNEQVVIGDVAFSGPDDLVVLFARANLVTLLQNEVTEFVPASQFAQDWDANIIDKPGLDSGEFIEMNRFLMAAGEKVQVGDDIPIQFIGEVSQEEALYKFFSTSGEVYRQKEQLVYRVLAPGQQLITVLAIQAGQKTALQKLSLVAEATTSDQTFLGSNSRNFNQRRESMASIFEGFWSSIRVPEYGDGGGVNSTTVPPDPLDLSRDGVFDIDSLNEATGEVTGTYTDLSDPIHPMRVGLYGRITFIGHGIHAFVLRHEDPPGSGRTIIYEGQIVGSQGGDFPQFVVAGRFRRPQPPSVNVTEATADGQLEGVWVATKP